MEVSSFFNQLLRGIPLWGTYGLSHLLRVEQARSPTLERT